MSRKFWGEGFKGAGSRVSGFRGKLSKFWGLGV